MISEEFVGVNRSFSIARVLPLESSPICGTKQRSDQGQKGFRQPFTDFTGWVKEKLDCSTVCMVYVLSSS